MRRIIITGAQGQLGKRLVEQLEHRAGLEAIALDRGDLDISDAKSVRNTLDEWSPDGVINAAAYTAVDQAEDEPELAHAVNAVGAENLAKECAKRGLNFIHLSTDYVFDGTSSTPYQTHEHPSPIGIYGASKLAGEEAVQSAFHKADAQGKFWIFRVAWLYDVTGKNFLTTMLRLAEKDGPLRIVNDQWGAPTAAGPLAAMLIDCIETPHRLPAGMWHYGTEGPTHWCEFAQAIFELSDLKVEVQPCSSSEYPTKALRPSYSYLDPKPLMDALGKQVVPWLDELKACLIVNGESK
jgi:dTDP-4-dehydrorhamnose reductase